MTEYCTSSALATFLLAVKKGLIIVQIIVPIILIVAASIRLFNLTKDPEEKNAFKKVKNMILAAVMVFMIPVLVNALMGLLGVNTSISACWNNAEEYKRSTTYTQTSDEKKKNPIGNAGDYEKGKPKNTGAGAAPATSISDKKDYSDGALNVVKAVDTNVNNPSSGLGDGRNLYRAVQAACFSGRHVVYAQNKNYGSIESSSSGGRICWSLLDTGQQIKCVEVGEEGGHMDGLAYDNDRGYILKTSSKNGLMLFDNVNMKFVGYSGINSTHVGITYVPSIHMLVGYEGASFVFYKYNSANNKYEKQYSVPLKNYVGQAVQGLGTDGTNIFIADSSPYTSYRVLYTYNLSGDKLETLSFGSGFSSLSDEVEAAFADNNGTLYLACPQGIAKVTNYVANKIGLRS